MITQDAHTHTVSWLASTCAFSPPDTLLRNASFIEPCATLCQELLSREKYRFMRVWPLDWPSLPRHCQCMHLLLTDVGELYLRLLSVNL